MSRKSIPQKRCTLCNEMLPATTEYFYKQTGLPYLYSACKKCHNKRTSATASKWQRAHPERSLETSRRFRKSHPSYINHTINQRHRYSKKCHLPSAFTDDDWQYCLSYFNHCCAICERPQGLWHYLAMDHWIPLSSLECPGTVPINIVPLCQGVDGCNNHKSSSDPVEWINKRFGKRKAKIIILRIQTYFDSLNKKAPA
jgi:hypothetical protein